VNGTYWILGRCS